MNDKFNLIILKPPIVLIYSYAQKQQRKVELTKMLLVFW